MKEILSFGKYAGVPLSNVPRGYIEWLVTEREKDLITYKKELQRRDDLELSNMSVMEKIVLAGFRTLAKEVHPDVGGTTKQMQELNASYQALKEAVNIMKDDEEK